MDAPAFSPGANGDVGVSPNSVAAAFHSSEFFRRGSFDYFSVVQGFPLNKYYDDLINQTIALERAEIEHGIPFHHARHILSEALNELQPIADPAHRIKLHNSGVSEVDIGESATEKILLPANPPKGVNYIGRIVGPRGISVRNLEAAFQVSIRIRGKGSVKDSRVESMLVGKQGYEHLDEALHVRIDALGPRCHDRVQQCAKVIAGLLTPDFDEYKRAQLQQLAVINGTYRPYKG
uniref:KH domain-containing protein n=1 Tax=Panagrellus redivivus TaxID=6233 RepID=A0A7E4VQF0_PANRE